MRESGCPVAPVSWGELLDKISILEIKRERIRDAAARANVARELDLLQAPPPWSPSKETFVRMCRDAIGQREGGIPASAQSDPQDLAPRK